MPDPMTMEEAERQYVDPDTSSIKRRWLRRALAGVVAVGPTVLRPPSPEPTKADLAARARRDDEIKREFEKTVRDEIAAVDAHRREVERVLARYEGSRSFAAQEMAHERRMLAELRRMLEDDLRAGPIRTDRDGHPLDDRDRAICRHRARELREMKWQAAARYAAAGDHRDARHCRVDALRSRLIAEHELHWRASLPGYGMAVWT